MPIYMNSLDSNKSIEELAFVNNTHVDISKWPKTQVLFSPRVGFNWDVKGDRSVIVSTGGTGIVYWVRHLLYGSLTNRAIAGQMLNNGRIN